MTCDPKLYQGHRVTTYVADIGQPTSKGERIKPSSNLGACAKWNEYIYLVLNTAEENIRSFRIDFNFFEKIMEIAFAVYVLVHHPIWHLPIWQVCLTTVGPTIIRIFEPPWININLKTYDLSQLFFLFVIESLSVQTKIASYIIATNTNEQWFVLKMKSLLHIPYNASFSQNRVRIQRSNRFKIKEKSSYIQFNWKRVPETYQISKITLFEMK